MQFAQRKVLGGLLAVAAIAPTPVLSETTQRPDAKPMAPPQSGLLSKSSKLSDSHSPSSPTLPKQSVAITTAAEAARARHLLDRYYEIAANAMDSNRPTSSQPTASGSSKPANQPSEKPNRKRMPASEVFEDISDTDFAGPARKKYVICGGGTAAWAAIEAIMKADPSAAPKILVIGDEAYRPYNRTMLSKEVWQADTPTPLDSLEYAYKFITPGQKIAHMRGKRAVHLDVDEKALTLSNGVIVHYDKLLLATGGVPKGSDTVSAKLSSADVRPSVSVFRNLADVNTLRESLSVSDDGVIVIGGGFLGTELAIALARHSQNVSLVVAEAGVLYRVLPRYLCENLARKIRDLGVMVACGAVVTDAVRVQTGEADGGLATTVTELQTTSADAPVVRGGNVVVAVGIEPCVALAERAGLELDGGNGGVIVNDFMMAEPDVFAAGDMASFHDRALGRRRCEHWDHAVVTGRIAGENMTGERSRYGLQSMFWSDLTNIGVNITAVGLVDSSLETVGVWNTTLPCVEEVPSANEFTSGVVYYLKDSEIVGVALWNPRKGSGALRRARALVDAKTNVEGLSDQLLGDLVHIDDGSFRMRVRTKCR